MSNSQTPPPPPEAPELPLDEATAPIEPATAPMEPPPQQLAHPYPMPVPPPPNLAGPYRIPIAPVEPPMPVFQGFPQGKPPRPILGSALAVYGVLLWSFVLAGQFATSWITGAPMSQGAAALIVLVATAAAWLVALQRSKLALPSPTIGRFIGRSIGIASLAAAFFLLTLIIATIFGQATRGHDFLIAFLLVAASVAGIILGPRLTAPNRPARTHRMKFAVISMWVIGVILTFVAGAELATNG